MYGLLIAVSGKLGSGKDFITENVIIPRLFGNFSRMAFADHIKVTVAAQDPIQFPLSDCLSDRKNQALRKRLQITGTEEGRDKYGHDIWINALENWIRLRRMRDHNAPDIIIVTDCRFPNEADWILKNGGLLIRIIALDRNDFALMRESNGNNDVMRAIATHSSETALDDFTFEYTVYNDIDKSDTIDNQIDSIIERYLRAHRDKVKLIAPVLGGSM